MIIDMHTHCFPDPLAKKAMPMLAMRSGNPYPAFGGTASGLRESVISGGADEGQRLRHLAARRRCSHSVRQRPFRKPGRAERARQTA